MPRVPMSVEEARRELDVWADDHNQAVAIRQRPEFWAWARERVTTAFRSARPHKGRGPSRVSDETLLACFADTARTRSYGNRPLRRWERYRIVARDVALHWTTVRDRLRKLDAKQLK